MTERPLSDAPDVQLDTLEAKGLIKLATVRPELEYLFRHALVQDAAYGSLLKQERRELHGRVGEALESLFPERREELAPVLAMHFEQAGDRDRAVDYFVEAARHALRQNAIQESYGAYDRAATLIGEAQAPGGIAPPAETAEESRRRRRRDIEIQVGKAEAGYSFLSAEGSLGLLDGVVADAEALGDLDLIGHVHTLIALGRLQAGEPDASPAVARSLKRIDEVGEALGDPSLRAIPLALVGMAQVFSGYPREGVAKMEEAVPILEGGPDSIGAAFARGALAVGYAILGQFEQADAAAEYARELAERGDLIAQLDAKISESMVRAQEGRLDLALPLASECVERSQETGASACVLASSWVLGDVFHRQGRFAEAKEVLSLGSDVSSAVDRRVWRPTLQAWLGSAAAALGEVPEADWEHDLATSESIGNRGGVAGIRWKRAEALAARGELDKAVADFEASAAIYEDAGARPNLARTLRAWGDALLRAGRTDEAKPILRRSLGLFEELGLESEAEQVRTALSLDGTTIAFG
jgi:tetratricopeptide (TPR) repeat protein